MYINSDLLVYVIGLDKSFLVRKKLKNVNIFTFFSSLKYEILDHYYHAALIQMEYYGVALVLQFLVYDL